MAYYTFAHLLHQGSLDGSTRGSAALEPSDLTDEAWDHVLLGAAAPSCPPAALASLGAMRNEFEYWYPLDLRVSGKDLIQNHLTMSLYNHAAIWGGAGDVEGRLAPPHRMPQGFFCNGHVLVDGDKMSKSKGNFILLHEAIARWSSDATRFALADSGDSLEDANFERETADNAVLRLTTEEDYAVGVLADEAAGKLRVGTGKWTFADRIFDARMSVCIRDAALHYEGMRFREALKSGFYELLLARDSYRDMCVKMDTVSSCSLKPTEKGPRKGDTMRERAKHDARARFPLPPPPPLSPPRPSTPLACTVSSTPSPSCSLPSARITVRISGARSSDTAKAACQSRAQRGPRRMFLTLRSLLRMLT